MKARSTTIRKLRKLWRDPAAFVRDGALGRRLAIPSSPSPVVAPEAPHAPASPVPATHPVATPPASPPLDPARVAFAFGVPKELRSDLGSVLPDHDLVHVANIVELDVAIRVHGEKPLFVWRGPEHRGLSAYARGRGLMARVVSEGPLRVAGPASGTSAPCSFTVSPRPVPIDDPATPRLHELGSDELASSLAPGDRAAAGTLLARMRAMRIAEHTFVSDPRWEAQLPARVGGARRILVLGEREDAGARTESPNVRLVREVLRDHPHDTIVFKPHPVDVYRGTIDAGIRSLCAVLDANVALPDALAHVDRVCVGDSFAGAEALFHGAEVTTYGDPYYAGRGLTQDRAEGLSPRRALDLEELFAATYLRHTFYVVPGSSETRDLEATIAWLVHERSRACAREIVGARQSHAPRRKALALRVGAEWRGAISAMLAELDLEYLDQSDEKGYRARIREMHGLHPDLAIVLWGYFEPKGLRALTTELGIPTFRFEDGFLRSVGIGAEPNAWGETNLPVSITLDSRSIYYNRHETSDVELLLLRYPFDQDPSLLARARACIARINDLGLTKYNVTVRRPVSGILPPKTRKRVLVLGQVERDASIRYGCSRPITNNDLVRHAAAENPDAEILYKPHPAVLRGAAGQASDPRVVAGLCRILHEEINLPDLFPHVDHVYTITSGAGFEALLHGTRVTCFGSNFYAGWGLTDDRDPVPRRSRALRIEEVFAAFYILHSRYYDHRGRRALELEEAIELLERDRSAQRGVELATRGTKLLALGDAAAAKIELEGAVEANPEMLLWWDALSRAHAQLGDWDGSVRACERVLDRVPTDASSLLRRATARSHLEHPIADVERDLEAAVRYAGPDDTAPTIARVAHAYVHGGAWRSMLDRTLGASPQALQRVPDAVLVVCCALIEGDRPGDALALYGRLRQAEPSLFDLPLRLRAELHRGADGADAWAPQLSERLARSVDRALPSSPTARSEPLVVVDDASIGAVHADAIARTVYVGAQRVALALVHVCPRPVRSASKHVVLGEHLFDQPVSGWHGLHEAISAGTDVSVVPREIFDMLTRRLGRRPSAALLLVAWLASRPEGLSGFDLRGLRIAAPADPSDSHAQAREKALFREIAR